MIDQRSQNRLEILSKQELARTLARLSSQILEEIPNRERLLLLGIPTRGIRLVPTTEIASSLEGKQVVLVDDVIFTGRTVRAAIDSLQAWGRPERVMLLVMVDRSGHRELPIQPDFYGRIIPTKKSESIELRLNQVDGEEGVFLV